MPRRTRLPHKRRSGERAPLFRHALAFSAAICAAVVLVVPGGLPRADAGGLNRVAVVADTGDTVKTACVSFASESITGLQALQMAGFGPAVAAFGGMGGAVCSMCDKGCPTDHTCLTCDAPKYWAYHRAEPGTSEYTYSQIGAGSTSVRDGGVEAWKYGTGSAPDWFDFHTICASAPPGNPAGSGSAAPADGGNTRSAGSETSVGSGSRASGEADRGPSGSAAGTSATSGSASASGPGGKAEVGGAETQDPASAPADSRSGDDSFDAALGGQGTREDTASSSDNTTGQVTDIATTQTAATTGTPTWRYLVFGLIIAALAAAIVATRIARAHKKPAAGAPGAHDA